MCRADHIIIMYMTSQDNEMLMLKPGERVLRLGKP